MLNKSRYSSGTSTRQNDVQGSSSRGPYKRWVPSNDYILSESETDAPKQSSHGPRVHHGVPQAVPPSAYSSSAPLPPTTRTSAQQPASSRQHRSERNVPGYSSESTAYAPPVQPKSGFSFLKHITKDSKAQATAKELFRPTVPSTSKHPTSGAKQYPTRGAPQETPNSTSSSADPSPRSSEDSTRNGNMSAPPAISQDKRKHVHVVWNPPTELKSTTSSSRKREGVREEKKSKEKDREDLVAQVTEALGQGSVVTKSAENPHIPLVIKPDDASSTRRTVSSTNSSARTQESHSRLQPQSSRHRTTLVDATHALETSDSRHLYPFSLNGYPQADSQAYTQVASESTYKSFTNNKVPTNTAPVLSKQSYSRSTASPWPFNQASTRDKFNSSKHQISQYVSERREGLPRLHTASSSKTPASTSNCTKQEEPQASGESRVGKLPTNPSSKFTKHLTDLPHLPVDSNGVSYVAKVPPRESAPFRPTGQAGRVNPPLSTKATTSSRENTGYTTSTRVSSQPPNLSSSVNYGIHIPAKADGGYHAIDHPPHSYQAYARVHTNSRPAQVAISLPTSQHALSCKPPTPPESVALEKDKASQQRTVYNASTDSSTASTPPVIERSNVRRRVDSSASQFTTLGARQVLAVEKPLPQPIPEQPSTNGSSTSFSNGHVPISNSIGTINVSSSSAQGQAIWLPPARCDASTKSAETLPGKNAGSLSQATILPTGGWASMANATTPASEKFRAFSQPAPSCNKLPTPPEIKEQRAQTEAVCNTEKQSTSFIPPKFTLDSESEDMATPKPLPKATISDDSVLTQPVGDSSTNVTKNVLNLQPAILLDTPGAWTTSKLYSEKPYYVAPDSLISSRTAIDHQFQSRDSPPRQANLSTTLAPGAWTTWTTTKTVEASTVQPRSNVQATPRPSPPRIPSPSPEGTSVGNGAAPNGSSSANTSDANAASFVQPSSMRVPISGHPSTPAPTRPVLRSVPPPLSISESTVPDSESLLTPSSLNNSPRLESIMLALSQTASTTTPVFAPQEPVTTEEKASKTSKKSGFFDFFKPKPASQVVDYEFWLPPSKETVTSKWDNPVKESGAGLSAAALLAKSKPGSSSTPIPVPIRPKSPKLFSPLKLFSKRHRTVSTASLDALDGTTANTVMNSPASSMHADMAGGPPSPPIRDPFLATQAWRDKEAEVLILSGRKRQPRPGVTFDCPDDVAPIDYVRPRLVRTPRPYSGSDDEG